MHNGAGRPPSAMPFANPPHSGGSKPNQIPGKPFQPGQARFRHVPPPPFVPMGMHPGMAVQAPMQYMPHMGYMGNPPAHFMVAGPGGPPMMPVLRSPVSPVLPASVGVPSSASSVTTGAASQQTTPPHTRSEAVPTASPRAKITLKDPKTGQDITEEVFSQTATKTPPKRPAQPPAPLNSGVVFVQRQSEPPRSEVAQSFYAQVHEKAGGKLESNGPASQGETFSEVSESGAEKSEQSIPTDRTEDSIVDSAAAGSKIEKSFSSEDKSQEKVDGEGRAAERSGVPQSPTTVGSATESVSTGEDRSSNAKASSASSAQSSEGVKSSAKRSQKSSKKFKEMLKKKEDVGMSDDLFDSYTDKLKPVINQQQEDAMCGDKLSSGQEPDDKGSPKGSSKENGTDAVLANEKACEAKEVELKSVEESKGGSESDKAADEEMMLEEAAPDVFDDEPADDESDVNQKDESESDSAAQKRTFVEDIKYSPGQWTPNNPEGKMAYSRDFLLQFQKVDKMPGGLPRVECVVEQAHNLPPKDFLPSFISSGGGRRNSSRSGVSAQQHVPRPKVIQRLPDVAPLEKGKNRWLRSSERTEEDSPEAKETKVTLQKVRGILNKLTPQNHQKLVEQMKQLPINNEERLDGCIDLCFEKAVLEPTFSGAYAQLCNTLMQIKVPVSADSADNKEYVSFRKLLLTKCQREFEKDKNEEKGHEELQNAVSKATTEEEAKAKKEELELQIMLAKKRSLGNIRFIGELFKLKMLTENIMHECLVKLLRAADEESLECLSRLLTTVGKLLDHDKAKPRMVQYFEQIKRIVDSHRVPLRIKFMLQDLMELRKNDWVPRHADNNPMTLDQIHRQIQEEQQQLKLEQKQAELMARSNRGERGMRSGRGSSGGRASEDGWQTAGSRGARVSTDPTQLKGVSARLSEGAKRDTDLQLGPGGKSFASWGRGSSGGTSSSSRTVQTAAVTTGSRYASLSGAPEAPRSMERRPPSSRSGSGGTLPRRQDSRGSLPSSPMRRSASTNTPGTPTRHAAKPGREEALQLARQLSGGGLTRSTTEKRRNREPPTPVPAADFLTQEEVEKKTQALVSEFLSVRDLEEARQCVLDLQSPGQHHTVVMEIINSCLDRKAEDRTLAAGLLLSLAQDQILSGEQCQTGIQGLLEFAGDMEIDIPHVWQYLAVVVSPLVADGVCQLDRLVSVEALQSCKKGGVFVAAILSEVAQLKSEQIACEQWLESQLSWSSLLPDGEDVKQFVEKKGVAFTCNPTLPFLLAEKATNDELIKFMEATYSKAEREEPPFVRMLVREISQSCICKTGNGVALRKDDIAARDDVFLEFLEEKNALHVEVVLELEAIWMSLDQPRELLLELFRAFYEILNEGQGFLEWEKVADKERGHGVALHTARKFLDWLTTL